MSSPQDASLESREVEEVSQPQQEAIMDDEMEVALALGGLRSSMDSPGFISRVSSIPLLNTSMKSISRMYEVTKESSSVIRYGAETVENVAKRITPSVSSSRIAQSLDNFASKQLDKVEKAFPSVFSPTTSQQELEIPPEYQDYGTMEEDSLIPLPQTSQPPPTESYEQAPLIQTRQKSRWETIVANVGGYVVSNETMQRLRYCLEWLQFAATHIDHQINLLRTYLGQYLDQPFDPAQLNHIRRDVVETVKRAVDLVGKAAATYLPQSDDNRHRIRTFLLSLPSKIVQITSKKSMAPSRAGDARVEVQRVLDIAQESREMLGNVESVFRQSVGKMEQYLGNEEMMNGNGYQNVQNDVQTNVQTNAQDDSQMDEY